MAGQTSEILVFKDPSSTHTCLLEFQGQIVGEPDLQPLLASQISIKLEKLPNNAVMATINDSIQLEGVESAQDPPLAICSEDHQGIRVQSIATRRIVFSRRPMYLTKDPNRKLVGKHAN